ncbi:MAG: zf-HC2 domain-containing protein [Anaerolineae bacterium]|nr:zf-HC2 domain-containing protein [Anaerolineae bacterium]
MSHLTEETLNKYLDEVLDPSAHLSVEAHLASCPACQNRFNDLQSVFHTLSLLDEKTLVRDLAPGVLARLPAPPLPLGWRLVLAIQAGLAMGLLGAIAQVALGFLGSQIDARLLMNAWIDTFGRISLRIPTLDLHMLGLPGYSLPISAPASIVLLVVVTVLWGLGNARLLRNGHEA